MLNKERTLFTKFIITKFSAVRKLTKIQTILIGLGTQTVYA